MITWKRCFFGSSDWAVYVSRLQYLNLDRPNLKGVGLQGSKVPRLCEVLRIRIRTCRYPLLKLVKRNSTYRVLSNTVDTCKAGISEVKVRSIIPESDHLASYP